MSRRGTARVLWARSEAGDRMLADAKANARELLDRIEQHYQPVKPQLTPDLRNHPITAYLEPFSYYRTQDEDGMWSEPLPVYRAVPHRIPEYATLDPRYGSCSTHPHVETTRNGWTRRCLPPSPVPSEDPLSYGAVPWGAVVVCAVLLVVFVLVMLLVLD